MTLNNFEVFNLELDMKVLLVCILENYKQKKFIFMLSFSLKGFDAPLSNLCSSNINQYYSRRSVTTN